MTPAQIKSKLRTLIGPNGAYRMDEGAPDAVDRASARAALPEIQGLRDEAKGAMEAKRAALLRDPEYVALVVAYKAAQDRMDRVASTACRRYRITVGESMGIGFLVRAQGDTWAEVFAELEARGRK